MHSNKLSNLAQIVYKRTYARSDNGSAENWNETVRRVITGNTEKYRDTNVLEPNEVERLDYFLRNRKFGPAGRGWWFSGAPAQSRIGGAALCNCWFLTAADPYNFVVAQDLLMLGGGVGLSVEHRFVTKLPWVKKDVRITHKATNDADFIVPDSREGWNDLLQRALDSFFYSGKSFSYSTVLLRGRGTPIRGFGGLASGPLPLVNFISVLSAICTKRSGKHLRPIDAADIICAIADMVVAGNVRRSAIIILGDPWDKEYLAAKRFDLGNVPSFRSRANFSVVCSDVDDLHPNFWSTYEHGEPFGIINRHNIQTYGRLHEPSIDTAIGVNPCAEATLESYEPCNLLEIWMPNLADEAEFMEAGRLAMRWGKRVTLEKYHHEKTQAVVERNRRVGIGITGCLSSGAFNPKTLDQCYQEITKSDVGYSRLLGINTSIRHTVVKPSGTLSLVGDCTPGIHPSYSRYYLRRVRFAANDALIPTLRQAGYHIEPEQRFDGTYNWDTLVVEFPMETPEGVPTADEGFGTREQLEVVLMAQKYWADQSVSCTVYYDKTDVQFVKDWLQDNLKNIKTISFLPFADHGFVQAPLEPISKQQYEEMMAKVKEIDFDSQMVDHKVDDQLECAGGVCPVI